jgi:hypothetical protein
MALYWLRAVLITGLAILYSEMAEAEQLRLECRINKQECYREIQIRGQHSTIHCTTTNPLVSILVEIDFEAKTWVEFGTFKDGTQTSASGNLKSVTQSDIALEERSYADGRTERETISRLSGAYSSIERFIRGGMPYEVILSGSCNKTTKPLPSAKF